MKTLGLLLLWSAVLVTAKEVHGIFHQTPDRGSFYNPHLDSWLQNSRGFHDTTHREIGYPHSKEYFETKAGC
jgi:hypothetical protein